MGFVKSGVGVVVGLSVAPMVLNAIGVPQAAGFGMDDIIEAAVIVASIMAVRAVWPS